MKNNRREEFLDLLAQHEAQLFAFLCAVTPSFHDAEDVYQQTVLTMWQKFADFSPGTSFIAWGRQIGRNKTMNLLQSKRASYLDDDIIDLLVVAQEEEEPALRHARRKALSSCLETLSQKDQELVRAAYLTPRSIKGIAAEMGRSVSGVYNSLSRIRGALQRCILVKVAREGYA